MNFLPSARSIAVFGLMALLASGCSGGGPKRPPLGKVSGTVTYKGKPVSGAVVSFMMERAPRAATGTTDSNGNYKLTTFDTNDGALVGTHKVTVTKIPLPASGESSKSNTPDDLAKIIAEGKFEEFMKKTKNEEIPAKYANIATSPLQFTIDSGDNEKKIELED